MNFFKALLVDDDDLDSPKPESNHETRGNLSAPAPRYEGNSDVWSFGDLIKTLSVQSESVIETYRKDLKEFGLGLRKESEIFRETASRAVKDLPVSLEATASAAHGALDGVLKSTADIIAKESALFSPDKEPETPDTNRSFTSGRYSWFEAQLSTIQNDSNTFCEEPENVEEYGKWKSGFELQVYKDEIDHLIGENGTLESIYEKIVPNEVDCETFWCRYFYRVDKLNQQERVRANLMHRTISVDDDDEELTWDVDDEEDGNGSEFVTNSNLNHVGSDGNSTTGENPEDLNSGFKNTMEGGRDDADSGEKRVEVDDSASLVEKEATNGKREEEVVNSEEAVGGERKEKGKSEEGSVKVVNDEKEGLEVKGGSGEGNDGSGVSSDSVVEEGDMGWDEIGKTGSDDDKKASSNTAADGRNADKTGLRIQLGAMDEDEELSWDIGDDDDTVKA